MIKNLNLMNKLKESYKIKSSQNKAAHQYQIIKFKDALSNEYHKY